MCCSPGSAVEGVVWCKHGALEMGENGKINVGLPKNPLWVLDRFELFRLLWDKCLAVFGFLQAPPALPLRQPLRLQAPLSAHLGSPARSAHSCVSRSADPVPETCGFHSDTESVILAVKGK